jgi:peroxiredoxin
MKKLLWIVFVVSLVACSKPERKQTETVATTPNDLPNMVITLADGNTVEAKKLSGKTVLILFQPDCDHCQHEARKIGENITAFRDHAVYFVSASSMDEIKAFANDYKLAGIPNVIFGQTTTTSVLDNFGPIQAPSIYIYSQSGKLTKRFNGQTDIGEILKYL